MRGRKRLRKWVGDYSQYELSSLEKIVQRRHCLDDSFMKAMQLTLINCIAYSNRAHGFSIGNIGECTSCVQVYNTEMDMLKELGYNET